jgi:hypothetical protein
MLRTKKRSECLELCMKRVELEKLLGLKPVELERCLRICTATANP